MSFKAERKHVCIHICLTFLTKSFSLFTINLPYVSQLLFKSIRKYKILQHITKEPFDRPDC